MSFYKTLELMKEAFHDKELDRNTIMQIIEQEILNIADEKDKSLKQGFLDIYYESAKNGYYEKVEPKRIIETICTFSSMGLNVSKIYELNIGNTKNILSIYLKGKASKKVTEKDFHILIQTLRVFSFKSNKEKRNKLNFKWYENGLFAYKQILKTQHGQELLYNYLVENENKVRNPQKHTLTRAIISCRNTARLIVKMANDENDESLKILAKVLKKHVDDNDVFVSYSDFFLHYPDMAFSIDNKIIKKLKIGYNKRKDVFENFYKNQIDEDKFKASLSDYITEHYNHAFEDEVIFKMHEDFDKESYLKEMKEKYKGVLKDV